MKKFVSLILALSCLCGSAALAETTTITPETTSGTTQLTLTVGETFTLSIPSSLTITLSDTPTPLAVEVSNYRLASNHQLAVSARTGGNGNIYLGGSWYSGCPYIGLMLVAEGTNAWPTQDNPLVFTANGTKNINLKLSNWENAEPGEYTDTATISVSIVNKPSSNVNVSVDGWENGGDLGGGEAIETD